MPVQESFNKANGANWGPDLSWTDFGTGAVNTLSNQARAGGSNRGAYTGASFADGYVECEPNSSDNGTPSPIGRCDETINNFYHARVQSTTAARLWKRVGGTFTQLDESAITYSAGNKLRLTMSGTDISYSYNGVTLQTVTDTAHADGVAGMRGNTNSSSALSDNFEYEEAAEEATAIGGSRRNGMTGNLHR